MNVLLIIYVSLVGVLVWVMGALGARAAHSGIRAGMIANRTDLAVLKPFRIGAARAAGASPSGTARRSSPR